MPLTRDTITASSRVMLVVYPVFSLYIGAAYVVGDPVRSSTPSFDVISRYLPVRVWGWVFLAIGLLEVAAWLRHRRKPMILALCLGCGVCAAWAVGFLAATLTVENASLTGPVIWGFVTLAHVASLQSLTKDSP